MRRPYNTDDSERLRQQIIGLGEKSLKKSYYPELQQRLNELEEFRTLLDRINDAIFIIKIPSLQILDINESACRQLGYKQEELIDASLELLLNESDFKAIKSVSKVHPVANFTQQTITAALITKSKKAIPFEISSHLEKYPGGKVVVAVARNISERLAAEEKYKRLYQSLKDGFLIFDQNGIISEFNEAFLSMTRYTMREMKGRNIWDLTPLKWHTPERNILDKQVAEHGYSNAYEKEFYRKDGSVFPVELRTYVVKDHKGNNTGFWTFVIDITQRMEIQQKLIDAKNEAEKANHLKSEFLAQMSHEIRTPINTILSFTSLLKEELDQQLPEDLKTGFQIINRAGKRLIRTIDLILNMSELQTGTYEYFPKQIDIYQDCLLPLFTEYKHAAQEKGLDISIVQKTRETIISADEYTVYQIFYNLIDNAVKYTQKGYVRIMMDRTDGYFRVEIQDTGIGISEQFLPSLFTAFTQEEQGYTRKFEGNGLGLALVKQYCGINNASIEVESKKNHGSCFRVIFHGSRLQNK